jgi:hypothetical protein
MISSELLLLSTVLELSRILMGISQTELLLTYRLVAQPFSRIGKLTYRPVSVSTV